MDNNFNTYEPQPELNLQTPETNDRKYGLIGGIISTVLGFISQIVVAIGLIFPLSLAEIVETSYAYEDDAIVATLVISVILLLVSAAMSLVGIILGAISIRRFMQKKTSPTKPIPTLILGIAGLVLSIGTMLYVLLGFLLVLAMVAALG